MHPEIQAYSELFHWVESERKTDYHAIHIKNAVLSYDASSESPLEFLQEWVWCESNAHYKAVGFKIFFKHAINNSSSDFFKDLLRYFPDLHVIHIQRRNYFDVLVSWLMAQQTGEWFLSNDSEERKKHCQAISPSLGETEEFFINMERADRFFIDTFSGGSYLTVYYDDLANAFQETCDKVFHFLNVEPLIAKPALIKQTTNDVKNMVSNYNYLSQHFLGTKYASFFDPIVSGSDVHSSTSESSWTSFGIEGPTRSLAINGGDRGQALPMSTHDHAYVPEPIPWPPMSNAQVDESYLEAGRLLAGGDKNGAIAILEHLWARQCQRWDVYCDLGALLLDAGRTAAAIAALRVAVGLDPDSTLALRNLAAAYLAAGEFAQLLVVCRLLLKQDPDNSEYIAFLRDIVVSTEMKFDDFDWLFSQPQGISTYSGWQAVHALSGEKWQKVLIDSVKNPSYLGFPLPGFPSEDLQVAIMGSSNADGLREGFRFHGLVKSICEQYGSRLTPDMQLLDFGTGWGRFARIFLKEFPPENILGIDVDKSLVDVCRGTFPYCRFETVPALPPTTLLSDHFGLIVAYSVFSHLSEEAANAWIEEFARILKPGGIIAVTTQGRTFLDFCEDIRRSGKFDHPWHHNLAKSFVDVDACKAAYDKGEYLYSATGGGDSVARPSTFYGETLIPESYVRATWGKWLEPLAFIDDRQRLPQALIVMRKRSTHAATGTNTATSEQSSHG